MDLYLLMWNIRGAVNPRGNRRIKEIVRKYKPTIVMLVETHSSFSRVKRFWSKMGYWLIALEDSNGQARGIWILSNDSNARFHVVDSIS